MVRRVTFVRTEVTQENILSIIRVKRFSELGATLAVHGNWITQQMNTK
jgi:hypothetical protein